MTASLVFLHGWCCEADHFQDQMDYFSDSRETLSIPWQSNLTGLDRPADLSLAASEIESSCLEASLTSPLVLIGHSMGGMLAAMIAKRNQLDIKAIVVVDATWPLDRKASDFFKSFIAGLEADFAETIRSLQAH